jgi:hypothetical protein
MIEHHPLRNDSLLVCYEVHGIYRKVIGLENIDRCAVAGLTKKIKP